MKAKDINWINYSRAFCIIMIYASHCLTYYGYSFSVFAHLVHPVVLSVFFFVSGYLFFRKQLSEPLIRGNTKSYIQDGGKKLLQNTLFRILIPTVIFAAVEYVPSCLLRGETLNVGDALYKTIGGGTYWFTGALMVAQLLLFILLLTRIKNIWFYVICSVGFYILSLVFLNDFASIPNYWSFKQGFMCMIFITLGGVYWKYEEKIHTVMKKKFVLIPLAALYVGLLVFFPDKFKVLIVVGELNFLGILIGIVGILVLTEICKMLKNLRWLDSVGKDTIGLYFMCGAWPIVMSMVVRKFMGVSFVGWITVLVTSFLFAYISMKLMTRFIPFVFDLRKLKKLSTLKK